MEPPTAQLGAKNGGAYDCSQLWDQLCPECASAAAVVVRWRTLPSVQPAWPPPSPSLPPPPPPPSSPRTQTTMIVSAGRGAAGESEPINTMFTRDFFFVQ